MKQIYTPQYPVLMDAQGEKCGKWANRPVGLVGMRCVKPQGHDGRHLMDVDPRMLRPDWREAVR